MKIAHVNIALEGLHRLFGGVETALFRTMAIDREQGHAPFLVTLRPDLPAPQCAFPFYRVRRCEDYLPALIARYVEPLKWYVWQNDPLVARDFRAILRREKPDIVNFHNLYFLGLELIRLAAAAGAKTCFWVTDYWLFCPNLMLLDSQEQYCRRFHGRHCVACLPDFLRPLQKILLAKRKRIFDFYLRFIDRWIVLSNHSATVLADYGIPGDKIRLVRLSLPFEYAGPAGAARAAGGGAFDPNRIFFAGWLQQRKGVHVLLEAMPLIRQKCPQAQLRIAGHKTKFDWDYQKKIEALMRRPGLRAGVTFLGHLTSAQVENELRQAAVVCVPEQYENMSPVIMIEAMAMEKAVVASRTGGIPEYIEEDVTGWLADPRAPAEFAAKITAVLSGQVDAGKIGRQARAKILAMCSKEKITAATMAAYDFSP